MDPKTQKKLSTILFVIGALAWVPYMVGNYLMDMDLPMAPFLTVHLCGVIPGSILKRWKRK